MVYYCKYCGNKASSIASLTAFTCRNSPSGKHILYEGGELSQYECKYCGNKASSIASLTAFTCRNSPHGKHEPAIQQSLNVESQKVHAERRTVTAPAETRTVVGGAPGPNLPLGCYGIMFAIGIVFYGGSAVWNRITNTHELAVPDIESSSKESEEQMLLRNQELLKAEQANEERRKAALEMIAKLKKAENARIQSEEQMATRDLRILAEAYPRTPEIHRQSYLAKEELMRIQREHAFKRDVVRQKYETIERNQREHFRSADELAAEFRPEDGTTNPQAHSDAQPALSPSSLPGLPVNAGDEESWYSVTGLESGDTLNVRLGAGSNYDIVARLPNGAGRIRIVGEPLMNGVTEWVQIAFGDRTGWVAKHYLKVE